MRKLNNPIFYITNDPERAIGLENILPNYHILCIDHTTIVNQLEKENKNIFCLEKALNKKNPIYRNSNRLLNHPLTIKYIQNNIKPKETPYIQVFKIAPNIERTAEKLNLKILNTSSELNRKFENKIPQFKHLGKLNPFPPTKIIKLEDFNFNQLQKKLGKKLVLQFNRGHTGKSTIFLKDKIHYNKIKKKFPKRTVRISKFIPGEAWTLNACQTRYGTIYGGLSYQITGIPECTSRKGGTVGNDWSVSQTLNHETTDKIEQITQKVGETLNNHGYRGMFGLDLIITPTKEVYLIEINAREPASTSMHSQLLISQNIIPLNLFHILEFIYPNEDYLNKIHHYITSSKKTSTENNKSNYSKKSRKQQELAKSTNPILNIFKKCRLNLTSNNPQKIIKEYNNLAMKPINAAQLFIRNIHSQKHTLKMGIKSGIYDFNLKLQKKTYTTPPESSKLPLIFTFNQKHIIKPGSEMARIQTRESLVNQDKNLYNKYLKVIQLIKEKIE